MFNVTKWKVRYWILAGYISIAALSFVSSTLVITKTQSIRENHQEFVTNRELSQTVDSLSLNIQILSRTARGYLLNQSAISLNSYREASQKIEKLSQKATKLVNKKQHTEKQKTRLEELINSVRKVRRLEDNLIRLVDQGKTEVAIQQWRKQDIRAQLEKITDLIQEFRKVEEQEIIKNEQEQETQIDRLILLSFLVTGFAFGIALFLGIFLVRVVSKRINSSASIVASYSSEIATTVEQQERNFSQQAASVNETTTTMDELGSSSQQVTEQAEAAADSARKALDLSENGTQTVQTTLENMDMLKEKVSALAEQITRLSEQTNQIGNISNLVSDLANQTNMLALNAAVEAVRAGEHGKGFAVVAAEIRKLADQSKKSAEKINALVTDIQGAINSTVMVTDEGTKTVDGGVQIAQESASAFEGVTDAVNNMVTNNQQILLSVKQQATAIQQVVDAMNNINTATKESSDGISQVKVGTQKLNEAAKELKDIV
jgi:CHASE3 domain sensor protein